MNTTVLVRSVRVAKISHENKLGIATEIRSKFVIYIFRKFHILPNGPSQPIIHYDCFQVDRIYKEFSNIFSGEFLGKYEFLKIFT